MRSTAATFEAGFDMPKRKRPGKRAPARGKRAERKRFPLQAVARYAAIGAGACIAAGIMVNALMLQKGHHPAPLFGKAVVHASAPAAEHASRVKPAPEVAPQPIVAAQPSARSEAPATNDAPEAAPSGDDPIARLLKRSASSAPGGDKSGSRLVSAAQRALSKLGFTVKANGTMNPATRKALEAFEKAHHLPSKGELDRRTVKLLAAESGMHVE